MRAAAVWYWRAGGRISVKEDHGDKALYCEGRRLLKSSEVNKIVVEEFENANRNAKFLNKSKLKLYQSQRCSC